jgi:hypothetical protein
MSKDGAAYLNGYVVNIGDERARKLNGVKIKVSGYFIVKEDEADRPPGTPPPQRREGRYKYIASPKIKVIKR